MRWLSSISLVLTATNKKLLTSFYRSRKVRSMEINHVLGFFQLPLLAQQSAYPLKLNEPIQNGRRIKPQIEWAQDRRILSSYKIQVKTLLNLSFSGSQMSTLLLSNSPQEICFPKTACSHEKFQKRACRVLGSVASPQFISTPLTNGSRRNDSSRMSFSAVPAS